MKTLLAAAAVAALSLQPAHAALFNPKGKKGVPVVQLEDPLRPLSSDEIALAVSTVREAGVFASSATFSLIALRDPAKDELEHRRQVQLVVVDSGRKETSEAVVDLADRKLTSWRLLVGVGAARAPFTPPADAILIEPDAKKARDTSPAPATDVQVDGSRVRWEKWRFRVTAHPREGLVISDASFDDRSVLHRGSASEIARLAADESRSALALTLVEGEEGFGRRSRSLEPRVDAPADATFLDAVFGDDAGTPFTVRRAIALYPRRTLGAGRELIARLTVAAGGREYSQLWLFRQDGEIQGRVEVAGSTTAAESHFFCYRLDLDVDGSTTSLSELGLVPASGKPLSFGAHPLRTTLEARRDAAPQLSRRWLVASASGVGGYVLVPGEGSPPPAVDSRRPVFLTKGLWALPYRPERIYAAGEYPSSNHGENLERWTREDEPLDGRDLVLWHTFGATTLPAAGHKPDAPTSAGFRLVPWGLAPQTQGRKDPS